MLGLARGDAKPELLDNAAKRGDNFERFAEMAGADEVALAGAPAAGTTANPAVTKRGRHGDRARGRPRNVAPRTHDEISARPRTPVPTGGSPVWRRFHGEDSDATTATEVVRAITGLD